MNGRFHNNLDHWVVNHAVVSWDGLVDVDQSPTSGSASTECLFGVCKHLSQCISLPVHPRSNARLEASVLRDVNAVAQVVRSQWSGNDCTGAQSLVRVMPFSDVGSWQSLNIDFEVPGSNNSILLEFEVSAPGANHWDAISLRLFGPNVSLDADLTILSPLGALIPGGTVALDLNIENVEPVTDPITAVNPMVALLADPRLSFVNVTTCDGSVQEVGNNAIWNSPDLAPEEQSNCRLIYEVVPFANHGEVSIVANETHDQGDPIPADNTKVATVAIDAYTELALVLRAMPPAAVPGASVELVVEAQNTGTRVAVSPEVFIELPVGLEYLGPGTCGDVIWTPGTHAGTVTLPTVSTSSNELCSIEIEVDASAALGSHTIDGNLIPSAPAYELDITNNADSVDLTVVGAQLTALDPLDRVDIDPGDGACSTAEGTCSLRAAIMEANAIAGPAVVVAGYFGGDPYQLTLTSGSTDDSFGDLDITDDLIFIGFSLGGSSRVPIHGLGPAGDRVLHISNGAQVEIYRVILRDGDAGGGFGGGIYVESGSLEMYSSVIEENNASAGGGIAAFGSVGLFDTEIAANTATGGAGVWSSVDAPLVLDRSTIHGNIAGSIGGGVVFGSSGILENSTVSGNQADDFGGGVYVGVAADVEVYNSTLTENEAGPGDPTVGSGGAVHVASGGEISLRNTIASGNLARENSGGTPTSAVCSGIVTSDGHNILHPNPTVGCGLTLLGSDSDLEALLGPLSDNGGEVPSHALLFGSPGIDSGESPHCLGYPDESPVMLDQTSAPRPADGDGDGIPVCDAGAIELQSPPMIFSDGFESGDLSTWSSSAP